MGSAQAYGGSVVSVHEYEVRGKDNTATVEATVHVTAGGVSITKGPYSSGMAELRLRMFVLVDGKSAGCGERDELLARREIPIVPGHYDDILPPNKDHKFKCDGIAVGPGSIVRVELLAQSHIVIGGALFFGDIWADVELSSDPTSVTFKSCSPNHDGDADGSNDLNDCDDANFWNTPGRLEICDGGDNNCDGVVDEGLRAMLFADGDGDGFGNAAPAVDTCIGTPGFVTNDKDCDDANPLLGSCNTPVSTNPAPISCDAASGSTATLRCDEVIVPGQTSCAEVPCAIDDPVDYSLYLAGECFAFETTATCKGDPDPAILCIEYDPNLLFKEPCASLPHPESCLKMFYCPEVGGGVPCPNAASILTKAPGTNPANHVYCAYLDTIPTPASAQLRSMPSQPHARGVAFLGVSDEDSDLDMIPASMDNCPTLYNPSQSDADGDGIGDKCE